MTKNLQAIYEKGILRPLEPLNLPERQLVTVVITEETEEPWLDLEYLAECAADNHDDVSLEDVRRALAKIPGSLTADFVAEREDR
jgi:predicted DNA-binding antitoxin AbrB/MazE fold protein